MKNGVVHFEIPVDNQEQAKDFYQQAFDWKLEDVPMEDGSTYTSVTTTPTDEQGMPTQIGINGGIFAKEADEKFKAPTFMINVESIDEALEKVTAAGGNVYEPKGTVPGMGDYAYFTDPAGNVLGLWQNAA